MTLQTILYFTSILLTCALTGFLAWYAWRQPALPGVRAYAWLALCECLMALTDMLSMLSGTQAQALFWFNLRFLFTATIPVIWLAFALAYTGQQAWFSKKLLAGALVIPVITQVMLWSNSLHGLWVKQEVGFHQNGPFWIAETSARIPGLWFMVHSFYSLALLLAGIVVILLTAWQMKRKHLGQALLLAGGALVALTTTLMPTFNLLPHAEFNPFIPGIGISALLYALAVFRFQFLKKTPEAQGHPGTGRPDARGNRSLALFLLFFILMVAGIAATGYGSYQRYQAQFRTHVEGELSAIAELKVSEMEDWRAGRMADAEVLYNNPAFAALVQSVLEKPDDTQAKEQLQTWLDTLGSFYEYDRVFLLDPGGLERISAPAAPEPVGAYLAGQAAAAMTSGQVTFVDFYRETFDSPIHLALLVPVFAAQDVSRPLGVLVLRIDPNVYLYPYINQWPASSKTAETLLVRRDGNVVLYLNELRFIQNTALNLRIPLEKTEILAVKAVLGQTGVLEGVDYRGQTVIGDVRAVPDSPWFLVTRMDTAEIYAPLRERLWETVLFFGALILAAGTGLILVWRQQRVRYYRAQAETAEVLRETNDYLENLFNYANAPIIVWDPQFKITRFNHAFEILTGKSAAEVLGKPLEILFPSAQIKASMKLIRKMLTGERWEVVEINIQHVDGSIRTVLWNSATLFSADGKIPLATIAQGQDITERKRSEQALQQSEKKFRDLVENAMVGVYMTNVKGEILYANDAVVKIFGFDSVEEFISSGAAVRYKNPTDRTVLIENLKQKGSIRDFEFKALLKTGETRDILLSAFLTDDIMMGMVLDITARKQTEQALQEYSTRLEADVSERTRELRAAHEALVRQERLATLGQLAGSIGHELRNPLGVISNAIYFLKMTQPDANDTIKEYLEIIETETRTSDKIVTDLLDFTRLKSVDRKPAAVPELVRQTLERFPVPPAVELTLELPVDLPPVYADPHHVVQVLGNLTVNACQSMENGGKLTISAAAQSDMIRIAVQDTGTGVLPGNMSKLFEPLFTTKIKGIGLGLAVCRKLAEANGGRIEVQSEPGKGSTFTLYLPIYEVVPAPPYHPESLG